MCLNPDRHFIPMSRSQSILTIVPKSRPPLIGRPSKGGGVRVSFRLSSYIITKMGLKKSAVHRNEGNYAHDSKLLGNAIAKGLEYLKKNPQGEFAGIESQRTPKGSFELGWDYSWTTFNQWIPQQLLSEMKELIPEDESLNKFAQRLVILGCAVDGIIQPIPFNETIPSRFEYQNVSPPKSAKRSPIVAIPRRRRTAKK